MRFVRMLEQTETEIEEEIKRELDENPALERGDDPDPVPAYRYAMSNRSADDDTFEPTAYAEARAATLPEHLCQQLAELDLPERVRTLAEFMTGSIDPNGYFTRTLPQLSADAAIATDGRLEPSEAELRQAFDAIRSLDPAGTGAMDLRDCLLLQLRRMKDSEAVRDAVTIVRDYFDLFSKRHYDRLSSRARLSDERLRKALDMIQGLNPKPGALIEQSNSGDRMRHIIPDFNVEIEPSGRASVSLNGHLPELAIAESFVPDGNAALPDRRNREARAFIRARHDEAQQLIRMVNSRAETLMAVMKAIVSLQLRFFESGNTADIKPMILKDVAELTGYDLSVISRATAGKYVATPNGVFQLKMLFNERRKEDSDTSAHEILDVISNMIAEEDKHRPLTDEAIKDRLTSLGYDIARRTVAKYREQLDLPVARLRRTL